MIRAAAAVQMAALMAVPGPVLACACCADPGARVERTVRMTQDDVGAFAARKAGAVAHVMLTACGLDCVKGVSAPREAYAVELAVSEAGIEFDLSDVSATYRDIYRGTVGFDWPAHFTYYAVDSAPDPDRETTVLYTEIRMRGEAYGDGDFETRGLMAAELVFSGLGNMCFDAGALTHWRLNVTGDGYDLRLYGTLEEE